MSGCMPVNANTHPTTYDAYSLSNVTMVGKRFASFNQHQTHNHKIDAIVFSMPSAIIGAHFHSSSMVLTKVGLFEHVIYSLLSV